MVRVVGSIFTIGGLAALIYFLLHYMHNSGRVSIAGVQVAHHSPSIWPIIITGAIMIIGVLMLMNSRNP